MTKVFRNIFISLLGVFAFLFAGFFFVGCGIDYSKISVVADKQSIELEVGQTEEITFTIENYQSGFSNRISVNALSNGQIFRASEPVYISKSEIRVKITGVAGGNGSLQVLTYEGNKECVVDVFVKQYSNSMEFGNDFLYVSNQTPFVPTADMFLFDSNTTYTELSYYYLKTDSDLNFNTYSLKAIDPQNGIATFSDGVLTVDANIQQFDNVELSKSALGNQLLIGYNGEQTQVNLVGNFKFIAVYDYSVGNDDYDDIVYSVASVYVLPDLDVEISGGYMDVNTGLVDFQPLQSQEITIVPNNAHMLQYILKVEMAGDVLDSPLQMEKLQSNDYVDIDFYDYENDTQSQGTVYYLKLSQNWLSEATTKLELNIFYNVAQNIEDESVNVHRTYDVKIQIAPTALTVNGTTEPERFVLYNFYKLPDFGWNELLIGVMSGYASVPTFNGVYFTFESEYIDLMYNGTTVESGDSRLYTDLSVPFYIRGQRGTNQVSNVIVTVHLLSDILQDAEELTLDINCSIIAGATVINRSENYDENYFYLDYNGETQSFDMQIWADQAFQSVSYTHQSGVNCVEILADNENPYTRVDTRYYLNLSVKPMLTGVGIYRVFLDNGMYIDLTFEVLKTLSPDTTSITLTNEGNEAVSQATYSKSENADFEDTLNLEILNSSTQTEILFGSVAQVSILANVNSDGITYVPSVSGRVAISKMNDYYRISTLSNGTVVITFTLTGVEVEDFKTSPTQIQLYVNVSSYSLVDQFYMRNGGNYALNNIVYYGSSNLNESDTSATLTPVVNYSGAFNFYQYCFKKDAFADIFDNAILSNDVYTYNIQEGQVYSEIVYELYNQKFIYYYAQLINSQNGNSTYSTVATVTEVLITQQKDDKKIEKNVMLILNDGLMFYADDFVYDQVDELGDVVATYTIEFSNVYSISTYGSFDMATFTYSNNTPSIYRLSLNANLRQRNSTKRYDCRIETQMFQSVESISLATSLTSLDFSNDMLKFSLGVYTFPSDSTNKAISVEFILTQNNPYSEMLTWEIDYSQRDNGIFTIEFSCEDFYNEHIDDITSITDYLTGRVYIYPSEWGDSYTSIDENLKPIILDVQYRNGSRQNPYLIQDAEDILAINSNETTLGSHYEISTVIDLSTISNATPIGILDGKLYGFRGSIVGTNSQASITNIVVSQSNFSEVVDGVRFAGLFALLGSMDNESLPFPVIENVSFSGQVNLAVSGEKVYAGILTAVNNANILNVGVSVNQSVISASGSNIYWGAVAGVNYKSIRQDYTKYESGYVAQDGELDYAGQNSKILAYFNDFVDIQANGSNVYAGGIAGVSTGVIERISSNALKLYGYSAYSAYALIKVSGTKIDQTFGNVYVGGAVGAMIYAVTGGILDSNAPTSALANSSGNTVKNLLLGGEIDTSQVVGYVDGGNTSSQHGDAVGGVVGYADTLTATGQASVDIVENTARVFLRANEFVGGILGYDFYNTGYSFTTNFGTNNVVEAVDDGRNNFYASMIIKYKALNSANLPAQDNQNVFFAVGNATRNNRQYNADTSFGVYSYLSRIYNDVNEGSVVVNNSTSTTDYYGDYILLNTNNGLRISNKYLFEHKDVDLELEESEFAMTQIGNNIDGSINVYFMYYFSVQGSLTQNQNISAQDEIDRLNFVTPNSQFYPFSVGNQDVNISTVSSTVLTIDVNGNITVKGTGPAQISLTSILNVMKSQTIYIYVVNYFDKDVSTSIFHTSSSLNGSTITDNSNLNIYGNSNTSIYVVPSYNLSDAKTADGETFSVSVSGILQFRNVSYNLVKNSQVKVPVVEKIDETDPYFSIAQIENQTIVFLKDPNADPNEEMVDNYRLTPVIMAVIRQGDEIYTFVYALSNSTINLGVRYKNTATSIRTNSTYHDMKTNNSFNETISVVSTNDEELVFYQIFDKNGVLVQERLPKDLSDFDKETDRRSAWLSYMNTTTADDLFNFNFSESGINTFGLNVRINTFSSRFLNRFEEEIYGLYTVHLYCSELENGVSYSFKISLNEADVNYVSINNYSNFKDVSVSDEIIVPSQRGLLEISIDPVEAVFDTIIVENSDYNYLAGATEAALTFAYEKVNSDDSKEIVLAPNFGEYESGTLTFTYQELIEFFNGLNKNQESDFVYQYTGKIYVSYYMPSNNVDDGVAAGFDVHVSYGNNGMNSLEQSIQLQTHLGSYARLSFVDKEEISGAYFVARGLSYNLVLDYYGFSEDQISISSSNEILANITKVGDNYVLNITPNSITYNDDLGYLIEINTTASKIVDNVMITSIDTLRIYIMEFVVNYSYLEGVNEDIVSGMKDGVISDAIGNPYELSFDIRNFLEYDASNSVVRQEVQTFIDDMTSNITWKVYLQGEETTLQRGLSIRTDYYSIESFTFTPLRIYNWESDVYHFSASAFYTMKNGIYSYSALETDAYPIYTEFSFDVHQQSTENSPIPVESYEEFMEMQSNEWYILMTDIVLPSTELASSLGVEQFSPITETIAGLDGNGYSIQMAGTYNYDTISNVGIFANVNSDTILQNVSILLNSDVIIKVGGSSFNVGLLTPTNDGIITNANVKGLRGTESLSVVSTATVSNSYVAGLVAENSGFITNSRSQINIFSNVNLAGFVAVNSGHIASSYFANASLLNETFTSTEFTAGFVVENSGEIYTSYVSGQMSNESMYYDGSQNSIRSSSNLSGFVYSNTGSIADCYSNIQLRQSGAFASGFVFDNSGIVTRCFSTSVLQNNQTSNYGFAMHNNVSEESENGIFDCYYLSDENEGVNVNISVINSDDKTQIKALNIDEFADIDTYFSSYVVAEGRNVNGVWFFNQEKGNLSNFNGTVFNIGRIELVAPNIIANSQRQLERIENVVDEETGATSAKYIYSYSSNSAPLGSVYNPILISDAETMETYILQENNAGNYNYSYYRLIADVDYSNYIYNSKIYPTKFLGYFEGNFLDISAISLISSSAMTSAGLFAQLGSSSDLDAVGTLMNFTFTPQAVSFSNTNVVGGLVGIVDNGKIYNVSVESSNVNQSIAIGNNIVGGAIGIAVGRYDIQNLYSSFSAKARYQTIASNDFDSSVPVYSSYSFAGSLIGVASGMGDIYNVVTDENVSVLADKAGLIFGLIDSGVSVNKVRLEIQEEMSVNAYSYGGLVVGESRGEVSEVEIIGNGQSFTNFKKIPSTPNAIGGYAGIINGGKVSDIQMNQSIEIATQSANTGVSKLGGIAGVISSSATLSNVSVNANLTGFSYVGGVAGSVELNNNIAYFENVSVNGNLVVLGHRLTEVGIGGLVGFVKETSILNLSKTEDYDVNKFTISLGGTMYLYGEDLEIFVGGIIGRNESVIEHVISNAEVILTGSVSAFDMSHSYSIETATAKVEGDETDGYMLALTSFGEGVETYQTINAQTVAAENVKYYSNISFSTSLINSDGKYSSPISLTLVVCGDLYIPS